MKTPWKALCVELILGILIAFASIEIWHPGKSLTPGWGTIRYRYALTRPKLLPDAIPALENRVRAGHSALDLTELASLYLRQGHLTGDLTWFAKAEITARRSLALLAEPNPARLTLGAVAQAQHRFGEAIEIAKKELARTGSPGAIALLVTSYLALGDLAEAARYADQGVEARPGLESYLLRALVCAAQGRDKGASYDFQRALALEDIGSLEESARARALWGRFLARHGEYAGAERLFAESLRIYPGNQWALSMRADMELFRGEARSAAADFIAAFSAAKQMRYLIRYARAKALVGERQTAADIRREAEKLLRAELTQGSFGHRLDLVELLLDKADNRSLQEALALMPRELETRNSAEANFVYAECLFRANRPKEAAAAIQASLRTGVQNLEYFRLAAKIEEARKNTRRANYYLSLG